MKLTAYAPPPPSPSGLSLYTAQWTVLTVDDCFDLGRVAYSEADYYHTELWMAQALRQLDEGETSAEVESVNILDYLSFSVYQQGALKSALDYTRRLLLLGQCQRAALGVELRWQKYFSKITDTCFKIYFGKSRSIYSTQLLR